MFWKHETLVVESIRQSIKRLNECRDVQQIPRNKDKKVSKMNAHTDQSKDSNERLQAQWEVRMESNNESRRMQEGMSDDVIKSRAITEKGYHLSRS